MSDTDDVNQAEPTEDPAEQVDQLPRESPIFVQPAPRSRRAVVGYDSAGRPVEIECESEEAAAGWDDRIWRK